MKIQTHPRNTEVRVRRVSERGEERREEEKARGRKKSEREERSGVNRRQRSWTPTTFQRRSITSTTTIHTERGRRTGDGGIGADEDSSRRRLVINDGTVGNSGT